MGPSAAPFCYTDKGAKIAPCHAINAVSGAGSIKPLSPPLHSTAKQAPLARRLSLALAGLCPRARPPLKNKMRLGGYNIISVKSISGSILNVRDFIDFGMDFSYNYVVDVCPH